MSLPSDTAPELLRLANELWERDALKVVAGQLPPDGYRVVDQFVVVPSFRRARMLLPAGSRAARVGALRQYNQLRPPRVRAGRAILATTVRLGVDGAVATDVLSVCAPQGFTESQLVAESITHWLMHELALGPLHTAIGVGNPGPNRKPTLQLFRSDGTPAGFAKLGSSDVTRDMVDNEARALGLLHDRQLSGPTVPTPLLRAHWRDLSVLATQPMPLSLQRKRPASCPTSELRWTQSAAAEPADARDSPWWESIADRARWVVAHPRSSADDNAVIGDALSYLDTEMARQPATTGPWHGDWVYWNMALQSGKLWVWDWEHFGDDAPTGFDEFHYEFQTEFVVKRRPVHEAMTHAQQSRQSSHGHMADWLPTAYLVEVFLRAARMNALGATWETRFHEDAARWLRHTTTTAGRSAAS